MKEHELIHTYRKQQVTTASPGQLIVMLYDTAIRECKSAQEAISRHDRDNASRNLLKAQDIVSELMGSLNVQAGGELGAALLQLYEYMYRRLVQANVRKDASAVREVEELLSGLRDAWARAAASHPTASQAPSSLSGPVA